MPRYQHTQVGWVILFSTLAPILVIAAIDLPPEASPIPTLVFLVLLLSAAAFGSLTVTVDEASLSVRFGLTPFRKRVRLADIASFRAVRNKWYFGWGIRYIGTGWLYNVSGLDAVEIVRRNGRVIRIGTDEPNALVRALSTVVRERGPDEASAPASPGE